MGEYVYAAAFILSIVMVILLAVIGNKQNITYYFLVFVAIMISNMGYYTVASAHSLETAVMGNRMVYLGGICIPILMLLCVMELCRLPIPKLLVLGLGVFSTVVLYYVFSVEYRTDYYTSVKLENDGNISYLVKKVMILNDTLYI